MTSPDRTTHSGDWPRTWAWLWLVPLALATVYLVLPLLVLTPLLLYAALFQSEHDALVVLAVAAATLILVTGLTVTVFSRRDDPRTARWVAVVLLIAGLLPLLGLITDPYAGLWWAAVLFALPTHPHVRTALRRAFPRAAQFIDDGRPGPRPG
ncbi:hypothetical protein [Deinococcus enclensis]|uniref:Uncharacterized membrane protein YbaN (DUF454 family) n=1 Tax=Deinococcus enclensis TaxID=1049582 RepID=A0ABT9MFJ8_9DEIO|nr:hypothetical protein [Deinococcus enclensis]MDP9765372.1 uncharacterized membrane protein YbaN (DUF454 family) [Deinococcus enclensis]